MAREPLPLHWDYKCILPCHHIWLFHMCSGMELVPRACVVCTLSTEPSSQGCLAQCCRPRRLICRYGGSASGCDPQSLWKAQDLVSYPNISFVAWHHLNFLQSAQGCSYLEVAIWPTELSSEQCQGKCPCCYPIVVSLATPYLIARSQEHY